MVENTMIEKWNVIDSADMAVSIQGIIQRKLNGKKMPFDYDESLEQGIDFLDEASTGGAIICGNVSTSGFVGTLSPLRWSTVVYIANAGKDSEERVYQNVTKALNNYKKLLQNMKNNQDVSGEILLEANSFFSALADVLLREADPLTRTYSQPTY